MNEGPWCRPVLPNNPDPVPRARGVDQLSWANGVWVHGPAVSTTCPGQLGPWYKCPWCRQAIPGTLGRCPRTHGVNQLSLVTRARVRGPVVSPSSPRRLGPLPVDTHTRLAVPFELGTSPRDRRSTSLPGDLGPGPRAHGFYQLPRVTRARVQGHAVSTSSPG